MLETLPSRIAGVTVLVYWACVVAMIVRVSRRTRRLGRIVIPAQRLERWMWVLWLPLIGLWISTPLVAARTPAWAPRFLLGIAPEATAGAPLVLRYVAAAVAVACLLGSILCWRHMGRHWRMGVDAEAGKLFIDGPFARVRHPIYSLSMLLMLATLGAVPNVLMLALATIHILLMNLKARNEERHLSAAHGAAYADYCKRVPRFIPRLPGAAD